MSDQEFANGEVEQVENVVYEVLRPIDYDGSILPPGALTFLSFTSAEGIQRLKQRGFIRVALPKPAEQPLVFEPTETPDIGPSEIPESPRPSRRKRGSDESLSNEPPEPKTASGENNLEE